MNCPGGQVGTAGSEATRGEVVHARRANTVTSFGTDFGTAKPNDMGLRTHMVDISDPLPKHDTVQPVFETIKLVLMGEKPPGAT